MARRLEIVRDVHGACIELRSIGAAVHEASFPSSTRRVEGLTCYYHLRLYCSNVAGNCHLAFSLVAPITNHRVAGSTLATLEQVGSVLAS